MNDGHAIPEDMLTLGLTEGHEARAGVETPRPTPGASSFDREEIKPLSASLNLSAIIADFKGAARALVRLQDRESADRKLREMEHELVQGRRQLRGLGDKPIGRRPAGTYASRTRWGW